MSRTYSKRDEKAPRSSKPSPQIRVQDEIEEGLTEFKNPRFPRPEGMDHYCKAHGKDCEEAREAYCLTCRCCFSACDMACCDDETNVDRESLEPRTATN